MAKEIHLSVQGYYIDDTRVQFPRASCIYFVYRGSYNSIEKTCSLKELLYVGEASDLYAAFNPHNLRTEFEERLAPGEALFYTLSETVMSDADRQKVVKALAYELRPTLNVVNPNDSKPAEMCIIIEGNRHAFVPTRIITPSF